MHKYPICVHMHIDGEFIPAGILVYIEDGKDSRSEFQYGKKYLGNPKAIPVDPVQLPLVDNTFYTPKFSEYFNGIRDSCPDSWGEHLIESAAALAKIKLRKTDFILYPGPDRTGAIGFSSSPDIPAFSEQPAWTKDIPGASLSLEEMELAAQFVASAEELPQNLRRFFIRGSSVGGARPKATVTLEGVPFLAKFQHPSDNWHMCRVEDACMRLAGCCGISVAPTSRMSLFGGERDILFVQRFDRSVSNGILYRIPFASMMTMCNLREHAVEGSYRELAYVTRNDIYDQSFAERDRLEIFKRMIFNVLCGNCDDHPRNHGFILGDNGWHLSPAYDITPIAPFSETLSMRVGEFGKTASKDNILSEAHLFGLEKNEAETIYEHMKNKVASTWEQIFLRAGVPQGELATIANSFSVALDKETIRPSTT